MNDIIAEAQRTALRDIQRQEDLAFLEAIAQGQAEEIMDYIDRENPLKTIYLGVLKYGWKVICTSVKGPQYSIVLYDAKHPNYSMHIYLKPGENEWTLKP